MIPRIVIFLQVLSTTRLKGQHRPLAQQMKDEETLNTRFDSYMLNGDSCISTCWNRKEKANTWLHMWRTGQSVAFCWIRLCTDGYHIALNRGQSRLEVGGMTSSFRKGAVSRIEARPLISRTWKTKRAHVIPPALVDTASCVGDSRTPSNSGVCDHFLPS